MLKNLMFYIPKITAYKVQNKHVILHFYAIPSAVLSTLSGLPSHLKIL